MRSLWLTCHPVVRRYLLPDHRLLLQGQRPPDKACSALARLICTRSCPAQKAFFSLSTAVTMRPYGSRALQIFKHFEPVISLLWISPKMLHQKQKATCLKCDLQYSLQMHVCPHTYTCTNAAENSLDVVQLCHICWVEGIVETVGIRRKWKNVLEIKSSP